MESVSARRPATARGLQPGAWLDQYRVVRRIGSGGMAELYLARLEGRGGFVKPVALKLMHTHLLDDPAFVEMFLREARIAARLSHPNIVQVLDVGGGQADNYLALEYVHGLDFRQVLVGAREDPLPLGCVIRIVLDVGAALHYAHGLRDVDGRPLSIVHRDVSPGNILVAYDGAIKLTDFGVARVAEHTQATVTTSLKGKLGYMSPEQCAQEPIDHRSDVFSLGVVLYEATTMRRPFAGEGIAVLNAVIDGNYPPPETVSPGYPAQLSSIVARALAAEASQRYGSAAELAADLEAFATAAGLDTRPAALAAELARRFGSPGLPDLSVDESVQPLRIVDEATTVLARDPATPKSRLLPALALGVVIVVTGLVGWGLGRSSSVEAETSEAPAAAAAQVDPPGPAAVSAEDADETGADAPTPVEGDATHVEIAPPDPAVVPPPDPIPAAKPAASTKRRRGRTQGSGGRRGSTKTSTTPAKVDPRDAMLPRPSP